MTNYKSCTRLLSQIVLLIMNIIVIFAGLFAIISAVNGQGTKKLTH